MANYNILKQLTLAGIEKPINPESFKDGEFYIIYRLTPEGKKIPVESQNWELTAQRGVIILTEHTRKNCKEFTQYYYEKIKVS